MILTLLFQPPYTLSGRTHDGDSDMPFDPIAATPAAPARLKPWSAGRVVESNLGETPPTIPPRVNKYEVEQGRPRPIAPAVIAWVKSCFAGGLTARPGDLIEEASEAARKHPLGSGQMAMCAPRRC
jgi:hypothetical protein